MISQDLLDILVCPACKTKVVLKDDLLVCPGCGRRYPIREGVPIMLIEEGDKLRMDPKEFGTGSQSAEGSPEEPAAGGPGPGGG